ncbi:hypothetical protein BGZ83_002295 [Gryganskiella cystojenkinii]|nr:hypothetical protein BGZ83_002295 [Gryganskiella cystojenkinii]
MVDPGRVGSRSIPEPEQPRNEPIATAASTDSTAAGNTGANTADALSPRRSNNVAPATNDGSEAASK